VQSFTVGGLCRSTTPVVWLITLVWALGLVLWSVLPPIFSAPDEPQHVDLILDGRLVGPLEWPAPEGNAVSPAMERAQVVFSHLDPDSVAVEGAHAQRRHHGLRAEDALSRADRPTHRELALDEGLRGDRLNQMAQHPPLYYRTAGYALSLLPGWEDRGFDVVVGALRMLSVLLLIPLPVLTAATARVLGRSEPDASTAALVPLAIPQVAHIGSVVTNDSLLILAAAVLTLLACQVARGDHRAATGRWIGGVLLVALLTKGFALVLPIAVAIAYAAAWRAHPDARSPLLRSATWAAGIGGVSMWWYAENLLRFGSLQPSVRAPLQPEVQGGIAEFAAAAWHVQTQTFWGRIGWAEVGVSRSLATVASAALLAAVLGGAWRHRREVAVLLLPGLVVLATTLVRSYDVFGDDNGIRALHGRYVFISLVGISVLAAAGLIAILPPRLRPWAWVAPIAAAASLHTDVWLTALPHFWTTADGTPLQDAVRALVAWSPWPAGVLATAVAALASASSVLLIALIRTSAGPTTRRASTSSPGDDHADPTADRSDADHHAEDEHEDVPAP
jgi:small subunit ribosomal protein S36